MSHFVEFEADYRVYKNLTLNTILSQLSPFHAPKYWQLLKDENWHSNQTTQIPVYAMHTHEKVEVYLHEFTYS